MTNTTKIEAYGVRGVKSKPWRKTFANLAAFERWLEKQEGDADVHGYCSLDDAR